MQLWCNTDVDGMLDVVIVRQGMRIGEHNKTDKCTSYITLAPGDAPTLRAMLGRLFLPGFDKHVDAAVLHSAAGRGDGASLCHRYTMAWDLERVPWSAHDVLDRGRCSGTVG